MLKALPSLAYKPCLAARRSLAEATPTGVARGENAGDVGLMPCSFTSRTPVLLRAWNLILLLLAGMSLAGCAGNPDASYYRQHRRALMQEVVRCENNNGALANTPRCQAALRVNAQLF